MIINSTLNQLIIFDAWADVPITSTILIKKNPNISENYRFRKFELPIFRRISCSPLHFELLRFDCSCTALDKKILETTTEIFLSEMEIQPYS